MPFFYQKQFNLIFKTKAEIRNISKIIYICLHVRGNFDLLFEGLTNYFVFTKM